MKTKFNFVNSFLNFQEKLVQPLGPPSILCNEYENSSNSEPKEIPGIEWRELLVYLRSTSEFRHFLSVEQAILGYFSSLTFLAEMRIF